MTEQLSYNVDQEHNITITSDIPEGTDLSSDISGLTLIKHGAKAESEVLNNNFTYLNIKSQTLKSDINSVRQSLDADVEDKTQTFLSKAFYSVITLTGTEADGTIDLIANKIYAITPNLPNALVKFSLPAIDDTTKFYQILVQLNISNVNMVDNQYLGTNNFFDKIRPQFLTAGCYDLIYEYDNTASKWTCGLMRKGDA